MKEFFLFSCQKLSVHKSHVTDITNASRTLLCNIQTGQWDPELLQLLEIPKEIILPQIRSCSEHFIDIADGKFAGIPITGCLGDQQAALVGNQCLNPGQAKATYGTGCFLLFNIGNSIKYSSCGLLTTVGFQFGSKSDIVYALEVNALFLELILKGCRLLMYMTGIYKLSRISNHMDEG